MKSLHLKPLGVKFDSGTGEHNNSKPLKSFFAKRRSKQEIAGRSMFGHRKGMHGRDLKVGKKFSGHMNASSISPSVEEFDDMMSKISGGPSKHKKSMFKKEY